VPHTILIPEATRDRAADYLLSLISGGSQAGRYLAAGLAKYDLSRLSDAEFLDVLINTKIPQIFAESAVAGDGSDWNLTELAILGDISISIQVFDPFNECTNARFEIHGISLMIRPLLQGNSLKSQLCPPQAYAEQGDDFTDCTLFSIVAWDHVSWPGNDFFAGSRCTDDGVKAAATDSMCALTGIAGHYDPKRGAYQPPPPYRTWAEVVVKNSLRL